MNRVNFLLFAIVTIPGSFVVSCDSGTDKSEKKEPVAHRNSMDDESGQSSAGFSLVQPDLPPSEDDAIDSEGMTGSLALDGSPHDQKDKPHPRPGHGDRDYIPPYFKKYSFKLMVLQNDVVIKELKGPYVPNRPLELLGLEPGKYLVKAEVFRGEELRWVGSSEIDVAKDEVVQIKITFRHVAKGDSEVVVTPVLGERRVCDYVPSLSGQTCVPGVFACTLNIGSGADAKKFTASAFCGEIFSKKKLLQKACDQEAKPTAAELSAIVCDEVKPIPHPSAH